ASTESVVRALRCGGLSGVGLSRFDNVHPPTAPLTVRASLRRSAPLLCQGLERPNRKRSMAYTAGRRARPSMQFCRGRQRIVPSEHKTAGSRRKWQSSCPKSRYPPRAGRKDLSVFGRIPVAFETGTPVVVETLLLLES